MLNELDLLFEDNVENNLSRRKDNLLTIIDLRIPEIQDQTRDAFSKKWEMLEQGGKDADMLVEVQKNWYLELYGFKNEDEFAKYLSKCEYMIDAGAGSCGKAAWFAKLSPNTKVIATDISTSLEAAAEHYKDIPNLYFIQCDIGNMSFFKDGVFDYVNCDQVIHHTANPYKTFQELVRITKPSRELICYVYRKKAMPRELLDEHFREHCKNLSHDEILELSEQLTDLGKKLDELEIEIDVPDIPALQIEGGKMSIQRFIYWNFIKCYWNKDVGYHNSVLTNYDWYSPSQAVRYSEDEFRGWITANDLTETYFHIESACYSGRFRKTG